MDTISFDSYQALVYWIASATSDAKERKQLIDEAVSNRTTFGSYFVKVAESKAKCILKT